MNKFTKFLLPLLFFSVLFISCGTTIKNVQTEADVNKYSCIYKGQKRYFYLFVPESDRGDRPQCSLIVMLHGYGESAKSFISKTNMEKDALPRNYAVLYLSGIPDPTVKMASSGWNYKYNKYGKLETGFIQSISKYIQKEYGLEQKKFLVGFSNGAFMVTKLLTGKKHYFEAGASIGGMMPDSVWAHKQNGKAGFFQINGTKDEVTPMLLNNSAKNNPNPNMESVINYFVLENGIETQPEIEEVNQVVQIQKYEDKVWWMLIKNYTHSWPSERYCKININKFILDFFDLNK